MRDLHERPPPDLAVAHPAPVQAATDAGLRRYMLGIYGKVALGLGLAAVAAHATATLPSLSDLMFAPVPSGGGVRFTSLGAVVAFSPLLLLLISGPALRRPTPLSTGLIYWMLVSLVGASMGVLLLTFTGAAVASALALSAAAFGSLSLAGYTTGRNLSGLRGFLLMGLVGLVGALALNIILHSPAVTYVANMAGVLIFAGLIAYDTQRLKLAYDLLGGDRADLRVATNLGALSLFINFINLFQLLLLMMSGERR